jgi:hypothetical protein
MAHFAQLDENNNVLTVIVVDNNNAPDELTGIAFCKAHLGANTTWLQTSYNSKGGKHYNEDGTLSGKSAFRYNFASNGDKYNPTIDAFYSPNPPNTDTNWIFDDASQVWTNNMRVVTV